MRLQILCIVLVFSSSSARIQVYFQSIRAGRIFEVFTNLFCSWFLLHGINIPSSHMVHASYHTVHLNQQISRICCFFRCKSIDYVIDDILVCSAEKLADFPDSNSNSIHQTHNLEKSECEYCGRVVGNKQRLFVDWTAAKDYKIICRITIFHYLLDYIVKVRALQFRMSTEI